MFTNAVFDTSPSGAVTLTGTDDCGAGALPVAVKVVEETTLVVNGALSNDTVVPATNPAPLTVNVKFPTVTGDGLTEVMLT
jgi:hypothetical protein